MHRLFAALVCVAAIVFTACGSSERAAGPCGLRLAAAVAAGEIPFQLPDRGTAERRQLRRAFLLCTLRRPDGSLFARLRSDRRERVLAVAFYRENGALRRATGTVHAATPQDTSATVKCGSSSQTPIGPDFWRQTRNWSVGATPKGMDRSEGDQGAQGAMGEWVNNVNHCGIADKASPPMSYEGETTRKAGQDGVSVVDWASLQNDQDCKDALACTVTAYDAEGNPVESDTRFNTFYKWSMTGAKDAYDIQSVAAHEWGHILQLDHSENANKNDNTLVMWPYVDIGDTSGRKLGRGDAQANNKNY